MQQTEPHATRLERDSIGELEIPADAYWGIHTLRAVRNFPFSGYRLHPAFIRAFALVKQACAETNVELKYLSKERGEAIAKACREMSLGLLDAEIVVDPYQGGAGTSTNMNVNEVIAGRASELLGGERGDRSLVHPIDHVNMHQSTNDAYPTALKVAVLDLLTELEKRISALQETLQGKEIEFRDIVKVSRTELTDAVPMTLGMTFGAWAEAIARDRWRIFKSRERIKRINLGGTAIGTGLGAPREYIFKASTRLRHLSGQPVSRAENMVDATQNMDSFVEVSGNAQGPCGKPRKNCVGHPSAVERSRQAESAEILLPPPPDRLFHHGGQNQPGHAGSSDAGVASGDGQRSYHHPCGRAGDNWNSTIFCH